MSSQDPGRGTEYFTEMLWRCRGFRERKRGEGIEGLGRGRESYRESNTFEAIISLLLFWGDPLSHL